MVTIRHYSLPECAEGEFINSKSFQKLLAENPNLQLIIPCQPGKIIKTGVRVPIHLEERVASTDTTIKDSFLWIASYGVSDIVDPPMLFVKALKLMDRHRLRNDGDRLFHTDASDKLEDDDPVLLKAKFDFTAGEYKM